MALFDPDIDSLEDVLTIRAKAIATLKAGGSVVSWSADGISSSKTIELPVKEVLAETLKYLKQNDPDTYGALITRTRPSFI